VVAREDGERSDLTAVSERNDTLKEIKAQGQRKQLLTTVYKHI